MRAPLVMARSPVSGRMMPDAIFMRVDLPAPLGPARAALVPSARKRLASFSISRAPKAKPTPVNCTKAMGYSVAGCRISGSVRGSAACATRLPGETAAGARTRPEGLRL